MKELSIEEKAKAYDEALARANEMIKSITNIGGVAKVDDIQHIFPELKESDDERIRGNIIATIHLYYGEPLEDEAKEMIAWLEKQGEQKIKTPEESLGIDSDTYNKIVDECIYGEQNPIDKVEPNFKVGDWVIWDNKIPCHVDNIYQGKNSLMYTITDTNNMTRSYSVKGFDNNAHLWTIQDARNGDILCSNQIIVLFKQWEDNTGYTFVIAHAGIDISGKLQITNGHWLINNKSKPATKEQRDTLMKAMADAGYAFDFEKKELKEIEPAEWSEECCINQLIVFCENCIVQDSNAKKCASFLKSLKERYTWKPSDEQMEALKQAKTDACGKPYFNALASLYINLKGY